MERPPAEKAVPKKTNKSTTPSTAGSRRFGAAAGSTHVPSGFGHPSDMPSTGVTLTIVAQDPWVKGPDNSILTAEARVPAVRTESGPRSHRFQVVDYDATAGQLLPPLSLATSVLRRPVRGPLRQGRRPHDPQGDGLSRPAGLRRGGAHSGRVRVCARRRLSWGFQGHELYLVPHAMEEANAFYSRDDRALLFGYFSGSGGDSEKVLTCLSHDIVAHETTHAILDGLRHRFLNPSLPDQAAFHEALADIVALLSLFSLKEVVEHALGPAERNGRPKPSRTPASRRLRRRAGRFPRCPPSSRRSVPLVLQPGRLGIRKRSFERRRRPTWSAHVEVWISPPRWCPGPRKRGGAAGSLAGLLAGMAISGFGLAMASLIRTRWTNQAPEAERRAANIVLGGGERGELTRSLRVEDEQVVRNLDALDAQLLGMTIMAMVR